MSFTKSVTVEIANKIGSTLVTDRVQGAQITTRLRVGDFGSNRAVVTLRNDDGALTPGAGGTFDGVDWFAQALLIEAQIGSSKLPTLFHGIITDFRLQDDGVNSTVVLEADDGYSVGGSSTTEIDITGTVGGDLDYWIGIVYNGYSTASGTISGVTLPNLGAGSAAVTCAPIGIADGLSGSGLVTRAYQQNAPARDFVRTVLMANSPNVGWPTFIDLSDPTTSFESLVANIYPVRSSGTAQTFVFAENAAAGELPFAQLVRGFPIDELLNEATITTIEDQNTNIRSAAYTNTASAGKYGVRSIQATQVMPGSPPNAGRLLSAETIAERWANTFSTSEFTVRQFTVTNSMVAATVGSSSTSVAMWADLLDIANGPLQIGTIEFTPAGGSTAVIETFVTMSRTIQITPADIRLTVECLPIDQTGAFVLDSSTLGVLDQNRLG